MSSTLSQEDVDIQAPPPAANVLLEDGDLITPMCTTFQDSQKPAKKQTRQWAAWTRQEEEKFFHALRQVGKNFEKITCRVQSKNKDQVRHYYYRLVRRMNKLLGPELCLDAKNSKDTVAAMLRWWSLLEKFSCSASKLHLRPRRFKILLETLENQLHKDRKKTRRKRPSQGEGCLTTSSSTSLISKAPTNDARPVKLLVVDSQSSHKIGANKGTSLRRNVGPSVSLNKGDLSTTKTVRQKRRGVASSAYRRWEKAAMDGVSLVADAAELLEQEANDGQSGAGSVGKTADGFPSHGLIETTLQPSLKLKLQLFPIDEGTRKALEKDAHNPHLELTLSARKRISSVLEHLNRKWGNSAIATGQQLMLVPYTLHQEDLASHQRWTARDTDATAADVYGTVGTPSIFRLRYGWFSGSEIGSGIVHVPSPSPDFENGMLHAEDIQEGVCAKDVPTTEAVAFDSMEHAKSANHISDAVEPSKNESTSGLSRVQPVADMSEPIMNGGCSSAGEWADSLTTMSVGDLLSEASKAAAADYCYSSAVPGRQLEQIPFSCDSFDAAIAAHVSRHQSTEAISHASIWNAEETCDEFSFRKIPAFKGTDSNPFGVSIGACTDSLGLSSYLKDLPESGPLEDRQDPAENVYWQDSLGFFEVDMPRDLILGESISLGGLSHLIASSVDAFQNCSFFGAGEARG